MIMITKIVTTQMVMIMMTKMEEKNCYEDLMT